MKISTSHCTVIQEVIQRGRWKNVTSYETDPLLSLKMNLRKTARLRIQLKNWQKRKKKIISNIHMFMKQSIFKLSCFNGYFFSLSIVLGNLLFSVLYLFAVESEKENFNILPGVWLSKWWKHISESSWAFWVWKTSQLFGYKI